MILNRTFSIAALVMLACASSLLVVSAVKGQQDIQLELIYRIFALIQVSSDKDNHVILFERISDAVKQIAKLDQTDPGTAHQLEFMKSGKLDGMYEYFPFQYVDSSGAKITVSIQILPQLQPDNLVMVRLGYGQEQVSDQQVSYKVEQLYHLIESACASLASTCILKRVSLQKTTGSE